MAIVENLIVVETMKPGKIIQSVKGAKVIIQVKVWGQWTPVVPTWDSW